MAYKTIIWDLDNTLYRETPEFHDLMDEIMAQAAVEDLKLPLDFATAKTMVTESYRKYRDGSAIFRQKYGINPKDMSASYHRRKQQNLHLIKPYDNILPQIQKLDCPQYVFSTSSHDACEAILKHIGLYDFFKDRFYSVEDFGLYSKNENPEAYMKLCNAIGVLPQDCLFIDDSYSNLECAKKIGMNTVRLCLGKTNSNAVEYIDYAVDSIYDCLDFLHQKFCS